MTREGYDISASEWEIMNTIWNKKLISANDVIEIVQKHKEWSPKNNKNTNQSSLQKEIHR